MLNNQKRNRKRFYKKREYSNPFFDKNRGRQQKNRIFIFKLARLLILILMVFVFWALFFSDYFLIKNIEVTKEGSYSKEINNLAWEQVNSSRFFKKNIFLFNKDEFTRILDDKYYFDYFVVKKDFPDTIFINYKEKQYSLVWIEEGKYYFTNLDGDIIREIATSTDDITEYPIIENKANKSINGRNIVFKEKEIKYAYDLFAALKNEKLDFIIEKFIIDYDANTIKVATNKKTVIYFNIEDDQNKQISKLITLAEEKLKDGFGDQEYIDLRYGDKIYYK